LRSRGNSKQDVFLCDGDRWAFLRTLELVVEKYGWLCHGYCLMTNHYHLLIETPEGNLAGGMKVLNGVYSQAFNRRHERTGHLYESRYKSKLVEKDSYLLELCRYIVLNPVWAGLAAHPSEWRWSSYKATCGDERQGKFLTTGWVLSQFSDVPGKERASFREFVLEGLRKDARDYGPRSFLGFDGEPDHSNRPPLSALIDTDSTKDKRKNQMFTAVHTHKYSMKEVADYLGVDYTTVARAIKRLRGTEA
jgi:REP element-mobilizing transposase RayT